MSLSPAGAWPASVILFKVDIVGSAFLESKGDAPGAVGADGPGGRPARRQAVQVVARHVDLPDGGGVVDHGQDRPQSLVILLLDPPRRAALVQLLEALALERLNHADTV